MYSTPYPLRTALSRVNRQYKVVVESINEDARTSIGDDGVATQQKVTTEVRATMDPVGSANLTFLPVGDYDVDDSVLNFVSIDGSLKPIKVVFNEASHRVLSYKTHNGITSLVVRKQTMGESVDEEKASTNLLGYTLIHPKLSKFLNINIVKEGENTQDLSPPFVVYSEEEMSIPSMQVRDAKNRYDRRVSVRYTFFTRNKANKDVLSKFEGLFYDPSFWGSIAVAWDSRKGIEKELTADGRGEYIEKHGYVLIYTYHVERVNSTGNERIKKIDYNINDRAEKSNGI